MLADEDRDWFEVARFCSYHRQVDVLRLKPWEASPSQIRHDEIDAIIARGPQINPDGYAMNKEYGGAVLLRRMLKLGVSEYDPDPLEAIKRAQAAKRKASA